MPVSRFCVLIGIPRRTYFRRLAQLRSGQNTHTRHRRAASVEACMPILARYAAQWPGYGHRRLHRLMLADGHVTSASTVFRALRLLRADQDDAAEDGPEQAADAACRQADPTD